MSDSITQAVDSTLSKNGVAADAAAVGAAIAGITPAKIGAAPAGYGYGETLKVIEHSSEASFETLLNNELATMADKQAKQIAFACSGGLHDGTTYFGTLTKNISGYAVLTGCAANGIKVVKSLINGVWSPFEWENPPMVLGVGYRTTERYGGNPVCVKRINCGSVSATGQTRIPHEENVQTFVDYEVKFLKDGHANGIIRKDGIYTSGAVKAFVHTEYDNIVIFSSDASVSTFTVQVTLKYVKGG